MRRISRDVEPAATRVDTESMVRERLHRTPGYVAAVERMAQESLCGRIEYFLLLRISGMDFSNACLLSSLPPHFSAHIEGDPLIAQIMAKVRRDLPHSFWETWAPGEPDAFCDDVPYCSLTRE
jgi:hypothetical protein